MSKRSDTDLANRAAAQRRYRARQKYTDLALMNGWKTTDIIAVFQNRSGEHIAIDSTGSRVDLIVKQDAPLPHPVDEVSARRAARPKRVYAPKSWDPDKWNAVVTSLREQDFTKDEARRELANAKTLDAKQIHNALAVVDAMPDTPDWYTNLPMAEVGGDQ